MTEYPLPVGDVAENAASRSRAGEHVAVEGAVVWVVRHHGGVAVVLRPTPEADECEHGRFRQQVLGSASALSSPFFAGKGTPRLLPSFPHEAQLGREVLGGSVRRRLQGQFEILPAADAMLEKELTFRPGVPAWTIVGERLQRRARPTGGTSHHMKSLSW